MEQKLIGLCKVNNKGILNLNSHYKNPAIKRHANNVLNKGVSYIQYGNARYLSNELNISLDELIEI